MYAYLEGKFTYKMPTQVYLDVGGVGYEVNISLNTFHKIQNEEYGKLFILQQIKEDFHTLWGFADMDEKFMFTQLIGISSIGAATARMMLSSLKPDEIRNAVVQNNTRLIESVKGIGKKTAERLILELKDKTGKKMATPAEGGNLIPNLQDDAVGALISLGINRQMAENAVKKATDTNHIQNLEELLKQALKHI